DYIIIDTPPTISDFTNNAILTSDYIVLVMQTQLWSLYAVETYLPYIEQMNETYNSNCTILGVVNMLLDKNGTVDNDVVRKAKEIFGSLLFEQNIYNRQRVKRYSAEGIPLEIKNNNRHDTDALNMYETLSKEILKRIEEE
ncbi:ParA family protein, partial [Enterococcus faecalis]